jgi:ankyrin repeat protein
MHFAALTNRVDVITLLSDRGASVNETDTLGYTPLHLSAQSGNLEATKTLVQRRAALDKVNKLGDTPLMVAAYAGRLEIVRFLAQRCLDINLCVGGKYALMPAVEGGHLEVIRFLLDHGAIVNGITAPGVLTPLQIATFKQNLPVVKFLLERGANVNVYSSDKGGMSALHLAVLVGNREILDHLIGWKVRPKPNLNVRDNQGRSPLCYALAINKSELAVSLIKGGADIHTPDSKQLTPLYHAVFFNKLECTKCLLQSGANVNYQGPGKMTALSAAIELEKRESIITVLLDNNANIDLQDDLGNIALHVAVGICYRTLVHDLIGRGADINIQNKAGHTPLHWIIENGWDIPAGHSLHADYSQPVLPRNMERLRPPVIKY